MTWVLDVHRHRVVSSMTYLWLKIAMNDTMVPHQSQRLKHLAGKPADQSSRESDKTIRLDQFVQVDAEEFHCDA